MIAKFYMKSGNVIEVPDVADASVTKGLNGEFTGWKINLKPGKVAVALITVTLSQIEAFVVLNDPDDKE